MQQRSTAPKAEVVVEELRIATTPNVEIRKMVSVKPETKFTTEIRRTKA